MNINSPIIRKTTTSSSLSQEEESMSSYHYGSSQQQQMHTDSNYSKHQQKHLLTPLTVSCSDSITSPLDTSMESTEESFLTTTTTTTSTTTTPSSSSSSSYIGESNLITKKVWVPLPSPSRPRLNPIYAKRLPLDWKSTPASTHSSSTTTTTTPQKEEEEQKNTHDHHHKDKRRMMMSFPSSSFHETTTTTDTTTTTTTTTTPMEWNDIPILPVPPPDIPRSKLEDTCSIFRPTPILTSFSTSLSNTPTTTTTKTTTNTTVTPPSSTTSSSSSSNTQQVTYLDISTTTVPTTTRTLTIPQRYHSSSPSDIGCSDRFIPNRATSNLSHLNLWEARRQRLQQQQQGSTTTSTTSSTWTTTNDTNGMNHNNHHHHHTTTATTTTTPRQEDRDDTIPRNVANPTTMTIPSHQNILNSLLRSELLDRNENYNPMIHSYESSSSQSSQQSSSSSSVVSNPFQESTTTTTNFLRYQSPRQLYQSSVLDSSSYPSSLLHTFPWTMTNNSYDSINQRSLSTTTKRKRRIAKAPFKVLDAPALHDDFYLNLVDWSSQNVLAVGLASCVYLWSACTSKVTKLCDLSISSPDNNDDHNNNNTNNNNEDLVTSVSWAQRGTHLAIGTNRGRIQLWDTITCKKIREMKGHDSRVGALAWSGPCLASGSRDRLIYLRDVRAQGDFTDRLPLHRQEVCGLKWSHDEPAFLASGGNDNVLNVIDSRNPGQQQPLHRFSDHTAAVKAITWSPHQHGLLASGGGTADRCIRFWNTLSGTALQKIDTGSQVCNLAWSQNCNEIVSTHGYSQHQIVVWRYPSMQKVTTLTGHTHRVLYLAMSPDGSTVVTGAGDETLRFWQIFPGPRSDGKDNSGSLLFPNTLGSIIR